MLLFPLLEVVPRMSHDYSLESWFTFWWSGFPGSYTAYLTGEQILTEDLPGLETERIGLTKTQCFELQLNGLMA